MASIRKQNRVESLIMRHVSEIIRIEVQNPKLGIVSITDCQANGDLSVAKLFVSFLTPLDRRAALSELESARGFIRKKLASVLTIRKVPDLQFILDDLADQAEHMEQIIKNVTK